MSFLSKIFNSRAGNAAARAFGSQLPVIGPAVGLAGFFGTRRQNLPNNTGSYNSPVPAQNQYGGVNYTGGQAPFAKFGSSANADYAFPQAPSNQPPSSNFMSSPSPQAPSGPAVSAADLAYFANGIQGALNQNGDIPGYAAGAYANPFASVPDLLSENIGLNNVRNDIAVGAKDPYKWASESGIPFTAAELGAIEKATAGIYDPALKDAQARLVHAQEMESLAAKNTGGTTGNQMTDNERAAQTLFQGNPIVKDYNTVVNQKNTIDRIITNGVGGPADLASIFTFMKALDPNSVVRESEYDNAAKSGNLFLGIWSRFNGYFKDKGGMLPPSVRQEFQNLINQKLAAQALTYNNYANQTREIAQRQGMNPDNVVIDFSGGVGSSDPRPIIHFSDGAQYYQNPDGTFDPVAFNSVGGDTKQASNRPKRNNNPLNIKASSFTSSFPGVAGVDPSPASDGGRFLVFASPDAGFNAAKKLLSSNIYRNLSVDQALRKWSNNGYGGEIVRALAYKMIGSLSPVELNSLVRTMAQREGFFA